MHKSLTIEQKLGITGNYQYNALNKGSFLQSNWHHNKLISIKPLMRRNLRVLDLGTGSGNLELFFANDVKSIIGVDYNPDALQFLSSKLKDMRVTNIKLIHTDLRALDSHALGRSKFDLIIMVDVIEHLKITDASKLISTLKDLLSSKGKICIITPNYKSLWVFIEKIFDRFGLVPHLDGEQHLAKYDPTTLNFLFSMHGFKCLDMKSFNLISWLFPNRKVSEYITKLELKSRVGFGNLLWGLFTIK